MAKISNIFNLIVKNESVLCDIDSYVNGFASLLDNFSQDKSVKYKYCYVKHNETDKPHYHIVVKFISKGEDRKRFTINTISNSFNINSDYIEFCGNERLSIRYLIHRDNIEKKQYCLNDIKGNWDINKYFNESSDNLTELIDFIKGDNIEGVVFCNFGSLVFAVRAQTPKLLPYCFKYAYALVALMKDISICG